MTTAQRAAADTLLLRRIVGEIEISEPLSTTGFHRRSRQSDGCLSEA
jgi:hypothetical protein